MTGLSRAQCARLIARCRKTARIAANRSQQHRFARRYTVEDGAALARVDQAHERLSGPATRHILRREFEVYEKLEFERLAAISNGHLYNLRASPGYRQKVLHYEKTRPAKGLDRRAPEAGAERGSGLFAPRHHAPGRRPGGQGAPNAATFRLILYWNQIARSGSSQDWKTLTLRGCFMSARCEVFSHDQEYG